MLWLLRLKDPEQIKIGESIVTGEKKALIEVLARHHEKGRFVLPRIDSFTIPLTPSEMTDRRAYDYFLIARPDGTGIVLYKVRPNMQGTVGFSREGTGLDTQPLKNLAFRIPGEADIFGIASPLDPKKVEIGLIYAIVLYVTDEEYQSIILHNMLLKHYLEERARRN